VRELFWAAFDAFLPGECAAGSATTNQRINNTNRPGT
jgi:hypothetical protein